MKKSYLIPEVNVVNVEPHAHILDGGSPLHSVESNASLNYGGGSSSSARVKENSYNVWNDDWSE